MERNKFKTTAGKEYSDKLAAVFQINKVLWKVCILQAVVIIGLLVGYLNLKETVSVVVELPSKIYCSKDFTVRKGLNMANADY